MTTNAIGSSIFETRPLTVTDPLADAGRAAPLGAKTKVAASASERLLAVLLTSTGAVVGGPRFADGLLYREAAPGTYTDYAVPANTGDQEWVYVANESGAVINRGTPVRYDAAGATPYSVTPMLVGEHPDLLVGVAQWDIADDYCGWVVCGGFAQGLAGGAGTTDGSAVTIDTGAFLIEATATDPTVGIALSTTAAASLASLLIRSR